MDYKKIKLNVSYDEKDLVKDKGARWDAKNKCWYFLYPNTFEKFENWLDYSQYIATDQLILVEYYINCYKCGQPTRFCALFIKGGIFGLEAYDENFTSLISVVDGLPKEFYEYLTKNYNYKERFNKTKNKKSFEFCCDNCDSLLGAHPNLYDESAMFNLITKIRNHDTKNTLILTDYAPQLSVPYEYGYASMMIQTSVDISDVKLDGQLEL